jgi:biotin synthase
MLLTAPRICSAQGSIATDWTRAEIAALFDLPFTELVFRAAETHRAHHDAGEVQLVHAAVDQDRRLPGGLRLLLAIGQRRQRRQGDQADGRARGAAIGGQARAMPAASRFCMGAAWRNPKDRDMPAIVEIVKGVRAMGMETCMTLGMLTPRRPRCWPRRGLDYYNHNIDTSPERYGEVITTRTIDDRLQRWTTCAMRGINVCSRRHRRHGRDARGPRRLRPHAGHAAAPPESVPVNALVPVKGTVLGDMLADTPLAKIDDIEFVRTVAVARITMPMSMVRLSAGRESMSEATQALCFLAGANSIFTGDKLLTAPNAGDDASDRKSPTARTPCW